MYELLSQLSELIGYHLLGLSNGYIDSEDEERWNVSGRMSDAAHLVKSWDVDQVWRDGEEWMGDALAEVVRTGRIEDLPQQPNATQANYFSRYLEMTALVRRFLLSPRYTSCNLSP
ncbi:hypothetical protein B0H19DRAFT_1158068 [Mycena capillaripes]|nr:hypothetical protein B0H19DRAFT_1158068 [Mycena capillaripes]